MQLGGYSQVHLELRSQPWPGVWGDTYNHKSTLVVELAFEMGMAVARSSHLGSSILSVYSTNGVGGADANRA